MGFQIADRIQERRRGASEQGPLVPERDELEPRRGIEA